MIRKTATALLLTATFTAAFALPASAHFCYNQDKPDNNGGTVTLENMDKKIKFVGDKLIFKGGFADPAVVEALFGADLFPDDYPDVYAHTVLPDAAVTNGSKDHGVAMGVSH